MAHDREKLISDYLAAYARANPTNDLPIVRVYSSVGGWYTICSRGYKSKHRVGQIIEMTATLNARADAKEATNV